MAIDVPNRPTPPSLANLLWDRYSTLLGIKRRMYFLRAFVDELAAVTKRKQFQIRNDIVWNMVLDARDKCVIDLYSWTVEMRHGMRPQDPNVRPPSMSKRGMFRILKDHYSASLTRTYIRQPGDNDSEFSLGLKDRAQRFARLFPNCTHDRASARDVADLCEAFRIRMAPLGKDRNKNRAHVHEGEFGDVPMHSVTQLEELFAYGEALLEDLSLVSAAVSFRTGNMNHAHCLSTASDLVDLVLFGNFDDVGRLMKGWTREALLARLHEIDDLRRGEGEREKLSFNQRQFDSTFEGFADAMRFG